ncbi:hypothetical protein ASF12_04020 [Paenibacillus sp. Leaf72]|nr:hypothetical protein ASF12_04020 [Paenibacillus sp. Leaf72]
MKCKTYKFFYFKVKRPKAVLRRCCAFQSEKYKPIYKGKLINSYIVAKEGFKLIRSNGYTENGYGGIIND